MARNHARILTAIWADADFVALAPSVQRCYLLLVSQPDLSPCGVLPYLPRRWAHLAAGTLPGDIESDIAVLEARRFVLVDPDTEELLIRTFVVHDGGLNNPKMRGAVRSALKAVHSPMLRRAVVDVLPDEHRVTIADGIRVASAITSPIEPQSNADDTATASNAEVGGRRKESVSSGSSVVKSRAAKPRNVYESDFLQAWDPYPRKLAKSDAYGAFKARRREGIPVGELVTASRNYAKAMAGKEPDFIMHGKTFFGPGERWKDYLEGNPEPANGHKPEPALANFHRLADRVCPLGVCAGDGNILTDGGATSCKCRTMKPAYRERAS